MRDKISKSKSAVAGTKGQIEEMLRNLRELEREMVRSFQSRKAEPDAWGLKG